MSLQPPTNTKQYTGHCHCGKFAYTFTHTSFENGESEVYSCNCSICSAQGLLMLLVPKKDFAFTAGTLEDFTRYTWKTGKYPHYFCPVCGTKCVIAYDDTVSVNVRTVDGVDVTKLKLTRFDGASLL